MAGDVGGTEREGITSKFDSPNMGVQNTPTNRKQHSHLHNHSIV